MGKNDAPPIVSSATDPTLNSTGFFTPGSAACFFFTFIDITGQPYDPYDFSVTITDEDATELVGADEIEKIQIGKWVYNFSIPSSADPGKYTLTLSYVVETLDGPVTETFVQSFLIVEKATSGLTTIRQIASREFLESLIGYTQRIPIWNETARFNKARNLGGLSFPRWNQTAGANVYLNGEILETGYSIDYCKGRITFTNSIASFDEVWVDYNFRWFTDSELDSFIEQGVNEVNIYPPQSAYTINNIPDRWLIVALYAAAINVLRRWLMDLSFAEPPKIFGSLQRAQDAFNNMKSLKENYEKDKTALLENKKFGPYVGLTKTITVPEFTLPGGRCLAYDSRITYMLDNKEFTATIEELYELSLNSSFQVLSDKNGEVVFAEVSKVWKSGKKPLLTITDELNNFVEVSEDHIMFVDDIEVPASEVKVGDSLTVVIGKEIKHSKVVSVEQTSEKETYDIEVPETENLFVNDIKCHNSRWFRYLFKGAMIFLPVLINVFAEMQNILA